VRGTDTFQKRGFECGRFVELLALEDPQGFADNVTFVSITSRVDEPFHQLVQGGWK
jgi:hypothetical protein